MAIHSHVCTSAKKLTVPHCIATEGMVDLCLGKCMSPIMFFFDKGQVEPCRSLVVGGTPTPITNKDKQVDE